MDSIINYVQKNKLKLVLETFLILFSYYLFNFFLENNLHDVADHFKYTKTLGNIPGNFLLFLVPFLLKNSPFISKNVFILTLSFSILAKFNVIYYILKESVLNFSNKVILLFSFALIFIFSLPSLAIFFDCFYLHTFPLNVWHNSTIILVMPFAILLYYRLFYKKLSAFNSIFILFLILLNIISKPSFLFVIIPLLSFLILINFYNGKIFEKVNFYYLFFISITLTLIYLQYLYIYTFGNDDGNKVIFGLFFLKWSLGKIVIFSSSLLISFMFPLIFLYFSFKKSIKLDFKLYLSVLFSISIYLLISEKGSRELHGNFSWQIVCSSFILFLFNFIEYLKNYNSFGTKVNKLINIILLSNLLFGVVYIARILIFKKIW